MTARNDITGDSITNSKGDHSKYADGWALAFGGDKKEPLCYNTRNPVEPEICIAELTTDERPISDI